jgi:hypothetical protein
MFVRGLRSDKTHCLIGKETTTSLETSVEKQEQTNMSIEDDENCQ